MSRAVLERKLDSLAAVDPDLVATGNPGCLMQLRAGMAARGMRAEAVHPVDLLDRAYGKRPQVERSEATPSGWLEIRGTQLSAAQR